MTTLSLVDSTALFADIEDTDAQLMQGGGGGNYFVLVINSCGLKICYGLAGPYGSISGDVKLG